MVTRASTTMARERLIVEIYHNTPDDLHEYVRTLTSNRLGLPELKALAALIEALS